ncbi:MAG: glycosyltransferase family 2 protein [Myxococcales bacterium]|nr:glycosyltransferase family 2 protein [Myxococcales bacterium]MCB9703183.1 glycosyltransferase family 2 protein [Myxococcales bacterium]
MGGDRRSGGFRPCALIPTYNNPDTVGDVVDRVRAQIPDVVVVDDGSGPAGRAAVEAIGRSGRAHVTHREVNGGKGAAVKTGFRLAAELGFTHALQVDADGQHALEDIPRFLEVAAEHPDALILGAPIYDESAPRSRLIGRKITQFWTNIETHGQVIDDPMCGFRVYPLAAALAIGKTGDRMDFDIEVAVKIAWLGVPVINLPTRVRYFEGGVSHFDMLWDNVRISWMHTRLAIYAGTVLPWIRLGQRLRRWNRRLPAA